MIYSYNTLGYYETKANRQYDNTGNERVLHHFITNSVPSFQVIVDSVLTPTATYQVYDIDDVIISSGSVTVENSTDSLGNAYGRLIFLGATTSGKDDGFYYIKITYNTNQYIYSDVFCWRSSFDSDDYIKITATTSDMNIGGFSMNMTGFTYTVYLEAKNFSEEYPVEEEGVQKTYGDIAVFNSRNHINEFDITGYRKTLNFLAGLRTVNVNGTVTIFFANETSIIYDIEAPDKKSSYNNSDIIIIGFKFKLTDYLQAKNEI